MIKHFIKDESGMTMALAVIMVVLIGVMGAGLLTFVSTDLNTVIEVNQGQKALEAADAGVQAAKRQVISDDFARDHYDGGGDDLEWSYCYNITGCTGVSPTSTGFAGMCINLESGNCPNPNLDSGNYAKVTILATYQSAETYRVISEGRAGDARRKIEAIIRQDPGVNVPPAYFSRSDITLTGSAAASEMSFFALGNIDIGNGFTLGSLPDAAFGKWATDVGAGPYPNSFGSYPNTYNQTSRPSNLPGVGAQGFITGTLSNVGEGTRSFDKDSTPYRVVPDYDASPLPNNQKIAFPFDVPTPAEDKEDIEILRQRALALERANPGTSYYIDSNPGNGFDDVGRDNGLQPINTWPSGSTEETVVFYEYKAYHSSNSVDYRAGAPNCATTTNKGAIVVQNGDVSYNSNLRFDGAIIIRSYDPVTGALLPDVGGLYKGTGTPCLYGYVNASGDMTISGNISTGPSFELSSLDSYRGSMEVLSWRELYQ